MRAVQANTKLLENKFQKVLRERKRFSSKRKASRRKRKGFPPISYYLHRQFCVHSKSFETFWENTKVLRTNLKFLGGTQNFSHLITFPSPVLHLLAFQENAKEQTQSFSDGKAKLLWPKYRFSSHFISITVLRSLEKFRNVLRDCKSFVSKQNFSGNAKILRVKYQFSS